MIIKNAQYHKHPDHPDKGNISILATIDGQKIAVPIDPANTDYALILKLVKEGKLTIKDAE